jgi:hypothetical protein
MKFNSFVTAVILTAIAISPSVMAHQTFLYSDLYNMLPGKDNYLTLYNGTYYKSGYSITQKMSRDISIVMGGVRMTPEEAGGGVSDVDGNPELVATYIGLVAEPNGTGLSGLAAHPDYIALPAVLFRNYLVHEGLDDALVEFDQSNELGTIRERYTKHAKGIFQVGDPLTDDYKTVLGYKAEIIPEVHPGRLDVGDHMSVQVLFDGSPAANLPLYVGRAKHLPDFEGSAVDGSLYALRTDSDGRATFEITAKDKWYIQLIHMQKVTSEDADYESNWSTLTFEIK